MHKLIVLAAVISCSFAAPLNDLVPNLPMMNNGEDFPFKFYSGYLSIGGTTRNLHYVYLESQNDPVNDPVLIWFNGGPGCSSLLGLIQEHGPYVCESGERTFHENDFSWNKEANVLYLESPVQVGYSYYVQQGDFNYTDQGVARDNLIALMQFFLVNFPERQLNDLWISGESYAGIYVPYLAWQIDQYNSGNHDIDMAIFTSQGIENPNAFRFNLKGFIVGNAVTNWKYDTIPAFIESGFWHGLYDIDLYNRIQNSGCKKEFEYITFHPGDLSPQCESLFLEFEYYVQDINVYDVYGICWGPNGTAIKKGGDFEFYQGHNVTETDDSKKTYRTHYTANDYTPWASLDFLSHKRNEKQRLGIIPPCTYAVPFIEYFNDDTVKQKLHISPLSSEWDMCNTLINLLYDKNITGSQWVYQALRNKYKILFYSGDTDGAVPTLGTVQWMEEVNWPIKQKWAPFFYDGQLAGYQEIRDGMTLVTIHGAGHMAPQNKRGQTYHAVFNFIQGQPI